VKETNKKLDRMNQADLTVLHKSRLYIRCTGKSCRAWQ